MKISKKVYNLRYLSGLGDYIFGLKDFYTNQHLILSTKMFENDYSPSTNRAFRIIAMFKDYLSDEFGPMMDRKECPSHEASESKRATA